jgi:hypothetical protein
MAFDPEREPEKAQLIADLLAGDDHVEVSVTCGDCNGYVTAVIKRDLLPAVHESCLGCLSRNISVIVIDPSDQPQP